MGFILPRSKCAKRCGNFVAALKWDSSALRITIWMQIEKINLQDAPRVMDYFFHRTISDLSKLNFNIPRPIWRNLNEGALH